MTVFFVFFFFDGRYPVVERYTDIKMCSYYLAHGRSYLKLYKNNSGVKYNFCIDLSDVKSFLIEN